MREMRKMRIEGIRRKEEGDEMERTEENWER